MGLSGTTESSSASQRLGSSVGATRGGVLEVVLWQEREEVAGVLEAGVLVLGGELGDAGLRVVGHRPAELLEADLLAGDGPDDVGPVMNMCEVSLTMKTKSVIAGE